MGEITDFTKQRLERHPVEYTVILRHDGDGMSFVVYDIQDTERDRLAVARDFEAAAESLRLREWAEKYEPTPEDDTDEPSPSKGDINCKPCADPETEKQRLKDAEFLSGRNWEDD